MSKFYLPAAEGLARRALGGAGAQTGPGGRPGTNFWQAVFRPRATWTARSRCSSASRRRASGHPDTLSAVRGLARVLEDKGDLDGAEALFRRAHEAGKRTQGAYHHKKRSASGKCV